MRFYDLLTSFALAGMALARPAATSDQSLATSQADSPSHISTGSSLSSHPTTAAVAASSTSATPRNIAYNMYWYHEDWNAGANATKANITSRPPTNLEALIDNDTGVTHLILFVASSSSNNGNEVYLGGYPANDTFFNPIWPQVRKLQAAGVKVLVSYGGYWTPNFQLLSENFDYYYAGITAFLKANKLDGIDLDIEPSKTNWVPNNATLALELVKRLRQDMGPDFIITFAPVATDLTCTTSCYSGFSYTELDRQAVDNATGAPLINWYNTQFYNGWGSAASTAGYDKIIAAGWDPARVVLGVLSSYEGSGVSPLATVQSTAAQLLKKYHNFGGVDAYEYARTGNSSLHNYQWFKGVSEALGIRSAEQHTSTSKTVEATSSKTATAKLVSRTSSAHASTSASTATSKSPIAETATSSASADTCTDTVASASAVTATATASSSSTSETAAPASPTSCEADAGSDLLGCLLQALEGYVTDGAVPISTNVAGQ